MFIDCLGMVLETRRFWCGKVVIPDEAAGRSEQLRTRLLALRPDVALINANLGMGSSGAALVTSASNAGIAVVVLVDVAEEAQWGRYLTAGARIVVPKTASLATVVSVVRRLCSGERVLDRVERERLMAISHRHVEEARLALRRLERLSTQEAAVLRALMAGLTVHEIASDRVVSDATVRTQVKAVLAKLEVGCQISAVAVGHAAGWAPGPVRSLQGTS